MDRSPGLLLGLPKPGRALKAVLVTVLVLGLYNAFVGAWVAPHFALFDLLACNFDLVRHGQVWRLLTSALLTSPADYSHLVFTLLGLYFLAPDLERRWGAGRFLRFLGYSVVVGNLLVWAINEAAPPIAQARFHPGEVYGASAAIAAIAVSWARDNADATVQMFFVVPMRGKWLFWITVGVSVLGLIYPTALPEGVVAPLGGIATGIVFGGSPSPARSLYLRLKLAVLRRQSRTLSAADILAPKSTRKARPGAPPLRVVAGGLEDQLRKRNPPKDKRYLN
jgi:membrane associated rhomboid family serine protease